MERIVKIALADDHVLFRKGLVSLLEMEDDFQVVLEAGNGLELTQRIGGTGAEIVLMDLEMPEMDGLTATATLRDNHPDVRVLMVSSHDEDEMILDAVEKGAKGYLLKNADPDDVIEAIRSIMHSGFYFQEHVSKLLLRGIVEKDLLKSKFEPRELLTDREREVLQLIFLEKTSAEIADQLFLSPRTIESYRKNMLEKVGVRNSVGLVVFGLKHKLLDL